MGKKSLLLVFFLVLMLVPSNVFAYEYVPNDCVDKGTCVLLCNYNNKYEVSSNYGTTKKTETRNISIYYYFKSKKWEIDWQITNAHARTKTKGPDSFSKIFSNSGTNIYTQNKPSASNFTCFNYGYLDFSSLNSDNELCFDNDGKTCKNEYSNIGTSFGKGGGFKSKEKDYDFEDDLKSYFNNWNFNDISCEQIYNGSVNLNDANYINNKVTTDIRNNYLHGNAIPKFMENSSAFKNLKSKATASAKNKVNQCINEVKEAEASGSISAEEADRRQELLGNIDTNAVGENFENAVEHINDDISSDAFNDPSIGCDSIFSDEEGSIGWMLNTILNYIKILGPVLVVLLSAIDFIKAVVGFDEKAMKEAQNKLIIRLVAALALFLVPTLVQLLLSFINMTTCTI